MIQYRTYTIRLFPNKEQTRQLQELSLARNTLYNILIDIEGQTYAETKQIKTEYDLDKDITRLRNEHILLTKLNSKASQLLASQRLYHSIIRY